MQWFRAHIRHGAALALVALLIQAVLSFGHSHARVEALTTHGRSALTHAHDLAHDATTPPDQDRHHKDDCAVCAVAALTASAISPTPPWLSLPPPPAPPPTRSPARVGTAAQTAHAFQPRAPPSFDQSRWDPPGVST
ncbi:MAG: hypothetical protein FWD68_11360 [Alphaproteobacteria bacterium]|nr:hypothetical protein [Alphaproteobacteria bacterium]